MFADEGTPEGSQFDWGSVPVGVYVGAAVVVGILVLLLLIVVLVAYRRAKRAGSVRRASLTLQAKVSPPGARRDLARLRLRLDSAMSAAASVDAGEHETAEEGDLKPLADQLLATGDRVARQLDRLAHWQDGGVGLGPMLPGLTDSVDNIERLAGQLIDASVKAVTGTSGVQLDQLARSIGEELQLVEFRVDALRELSGSTPAGSPPTAP